MSNIVFMKVICIDMNTLWLH